MSSARVEPAASEIDLLNSLARGFYTVLEARYRTYCSVGARVVQKVLASHGIASRLLPCQLFGLNATKRHVVGFTGAAAPDKWDGHVVCATERWIVDTATSHLKLEAGFDVPEAVVGRVVPGVRTAVYGECIPNPTTLLLWLNPPQGFDPSPPQEPPAVVDELARRLLAHLQDTRRAQAG